ncbi:hypothetical protein [Pseudonocardia sp.]|uniref:hypothetical protein n=1 Tax=Pseudonocardia sp. TaxID=60912 RepID=UPI00262E654A|nr:hypothetical protein [Pseudonocardia sp.]
MAASLRWIRPDLTRALAEYRMESASAEADRDTWLLAAGWRLHAAAAAGDGREVAADVLDRLPGWGAQVLVAPAAGRLRIELAVLAHDAGAVTASRALMPAIPARGAEPEFVADVLTAAARCALADAHAPDAATTASTLAPGLAAWASVGGVRGELGAAGMQAVGAAAVRRAGQPEVAVTLAVDGMHRLDRCRPTPESPSPSAHLAAALAVEWIAALIEAGRPEQAQDGSGPLQDRLVESARPTPQLALLRLTIARATASDPRPPRPAAARELERAASDAAASDVPALEHVCRTALGELYEAMDRPADSVESIRKAVEADRRNRSRAARFRSAIAHAEPFWRIGSPGPDTVGSDAATVDVVPLPVPAGSGAPSSVTTPPGHSRSTPAGVAGEDTDRGRGDARSTEGEWAGVGRAARDAARNEVGPGGARSVGGVATVDPWATGTWPSGRTGPESGAGPGGLPRAVDVTGLTAGPSPHDPAGVDPADLDPADLDPTDAFSGVARTDQRSDGAAADVTGTPGSTPEAGEQDPLDPTVPIASGPGGPADAGRTAREVAALDPDTWLAAALADLDRIWKVGDDPVRVLDDAPVAVTDGDCVVVLDLAMAGERLPAEASVPTVRRLVRRLEDRLPPRSRLRDDGPETVSVVLSGRDRASAAEWVQRVLPDLVDGLVVDTAAGSALLRAAVHDADGTAGSQVLQRLGGTRGGDDTATREPDPTARRSAGQATPASRKPSGSSGEGAPSGSFTVARENGVPETGAAANGAGGSGAAGAGGPAGSEAAGHGAIGNGAAATAPASKSPERHAAGDGAPGEDVAGDDVAGPDSAGSATLAGGAPGRSASGNDASGNDLAGVGVAGAGTAVGTAVRDGATRDAVLGDGALGSSALDSSALGSSTVGSDAAGAAPAGNGVAGNGAAGNGVAGNGAAGQVESREARATVPRPAARHGQSGERRPYLPAGVVVRPGSGGRRHRRPAEPATGGADGGVVPGTDPSARQVPVASAEADRTAPTQPGVAPQEHDTPSAIADADGAGGGPGGGPAAGPEGRGRAVADAPEDGDLPSPDGLGLADLLAGALAAYRRI